MTPARVIAFLSDVRACARWAETDPDTFTLEGHPDDDHLFHLAIAAQVDFLVTWETRILALDSADSLEGTRLRALVPQLRVLNPPAFLHALANLEAAQ